MRIAISCRSAGVSLGSSAKMSALLMTLSNLITTARIGKGRNDARHRWQRHRAARWHDWRQQFDGQARRLRLDRHRRGAAGTLHPAATAAFYRLERATDERPDADPKITSHSSLRQQAN